MSILQRIKNNMSKIFKLSETVCLQMSLCNSYNTSSVLNIMCAVHVEQSVNPSHCGSNTTLNTNGAKL